MAFLISAVFLVFVFIESEGNDIDLTEQPIIRNDQVTEAIQINFSNQSVVSELQHTICSIKTEDVVAKAQSTASRILTGVCTSEEMIKAFKNMENTFLERLEQVQLNLVTFIQSKFQPVVQKNNYVKNPIATPVRTIDYLFGKTLFKNLR